jgi:tetratricopeptide (TPR) repeat protein
MKLNPDYATTYEWYGLCLAYMGRHEEAIAAVKRAQDLDPLTMIITTVLGVVLHYAHQYERAIEEYDKVIEMDPTFLPAHCFRGATYTRLGIHEKALADLRFCIERGGRGPLVMAALGYAQAAVGDRKGAEETLADLEQESQERYVSPFFAGQILAGLGEHERALDCLEKACEERFHRVAGIKVDSILESLRPYPRFQTLLKRIGLT